MIRVFPSSSPPLALLFLILMSLCHLYFLHVLPTTLDAYFHVRYGIYCYPFLAPLFPLAIILRFLF